MRAIWVVCNNGHAISEAVGYSKSFTMSFIPKYISLNPRGNYTVVKYLPAKQGKKRGKKS